MGRCIHINYNKWMIDDMNILFIVGYSGSGKSTDMFKSILRIIIREISTKGFNTGADIVYRNVLCKYKFYINDIRLLRILKQYVMTSE